MILSAMDDITPTVVGVSEQLAAGARFVAAFFDTLADQRMIHYVIAVDGKLETRTGRVSGGSIPSLAADHPAADWAEREIRDRYGLDFTGLPETRPLLPPADPSTLRRVRGDEVSTILYGPIRSGVVESARWVIETAGEDFLSVYPSMFFKHRGIEDVFRATPLERATFVAEHVSGATAASHATCFARAVELALNLIPHAASQAARVVLVELERIHQHLDALAKLADDGSLSVGAAQTFAAKERVHRLLAAATGNRFSRGVILVGGTREHLFQDIQAVCAAELDAVEHEANDVVSGLFHTQSLLDRLIGTGHLNAELVHAHGGVGPVARGSNVANDVRMAGDVLLSLGEADEVLEPGGDAFARALVRAEEIKRSFYIIRNALKQTGSELRAVMGPRDSGGAIARVESPQGELVYYVRIEQRQIRRVAIRSASFANWPLFVYTLPGNIFTDFSFIEHSFGLIQAETDR